MKLLNRAPAWKPPRSRKVTLWHGCTTSDKNAIERHGIDPTVGKVNTDFGRSFYTTTIERQARQWAWNRFYDSKFKRVSGHQPVVLRFVVDRFLLADLKSLSFCVGHPSNDDFWSLVQHCRRSTTTKVNDHDGPVIEDGRWYDVVSGPVAAFWKQRAAIHDSDQLSFHTKAGADVLTDLIRSGDQSKYQWAPVT